MKTNHGLAVLQRTEDGEGYHVLHICFYEQPPTQNDVNALIEELRTDTEFGLTDLVCDEDYELHEYTGELLAKLKALYGIPDDLGDDVPMTNKIKLPDEIVKQVRDAV